MIKIGLIQMKIDEKKENNLKRAEELIIKAKKSNIDIAVLPEMFNCPYETKNFPIYAEEEMGYSCKYLSKIAKENNIILVGGSIPELDKEKHVYNTCYVFDNEGKIIGKHRKMHLFDIDVSNGQAFKESDTLTAGDSITITDTKFGKIGIAICYDFRFPELSRLMVDEGVKMIIVPAAFNMTTGPAHWEILFRTRALDNQVFTIGTSPARDEKSNYVSYGNSIVVNPWGKIIDKLDENEGILICDIDLEEVDSVREELPLLKHRRKDLYELKLK